ncbi:peroxiredoxin (alkyl hydroperoxide reductase subunit C) [Tindallia californiensis]|uniref:Peroxiredoxin (Alkyl hydroperoxide reductase subunit C) n=3 Tax=Tindallia californiensis TaxID=159292 RepID=A0A1H3MGA4_9FIRM|nr:peroxiredoxin (alkyl hydroperoxide reductase subunit C) [Tindallia californiensis]
MPEEFKPGCKRPTVQKKEKDISLNSEKLVEKPKEERSMIKVGKPAPVFKAPAYHQGKFVNVDLEEFKGKWVLLCFYPGDFTFV